MLNSIFSIFEMIFTSLYLKVCDLVRKIFPVFPANSNMPKYAKFCGEKIQKMY